jgi:cephalosporin hydroxylase
MNKKIFTRSEFTVHLGKSAKMMASDKKLQRGALSVLIKADKHNWVHQTNWFGEPILNLPQDLFAFQEIIYKTKPRFIIEIGIAWGGSLLFYSTLMEILGGEKIIGVDIFIPNDLKKRINSYGQLSKRISLIRGSSIDDKTIKKILKITKGSKEVLVFLDSNHTHDHVFKELNLYSQFVGKGHYLICGDTIIEMIPPQKHRPRTWGPGNNPKTALDVFLKKNDRFQVDKALENKLLLTCNPGGYLKAIKD